MIVSNLRNKTAQYFLRPNPFRQSQALQWFGTKTKLSADDTMENIDDIFKMMSRDMSDIEKIELDPRIVQQKEDVVYIKNPRQDWAQNRVLNFTNEGVSAITLCLQEQQAIALMLKRSTVALTDSEVQIEQNESLKVKLGWGKTQTATGHVIDQSSCTQETEIDLVAKLPKASLKRKLISEQLLTGHMRIDLGRPMAKGNFIILKGPSRRGKTTIAYSTIKQFLNESTEHKAIYIGLQQNSGKKLMQSLPEECQDRAMVIGVDQLSAEHALDANFVLAPRAALQASAQCKKVLLVFDDVLLHTFKEKYVYDLASQPFAPTNIINELMEQTGNFQDGRVVSTLVLADTEANQLQFQRDEDAIMVHMESLADQVIEFEDEQHKRRLGSKLPVLPSKTGQKMPHQSVILRPFLRALCNKFQHLTDEIDKAYVKHNGKEMMKIQEDPWDNYLYYDSKYVLPIVCHGQDMPIEKQALLTMFIQKSVQDETISQYKLQGSKLVNALFDFVENEFDFDAIVNNADVDEEDEDDIDDLLKPKKKEHSLLEHLQESCSSTGNLNRPETAQTVQEVDRAFKMFYLQMQMSGQLNEFKDDYFV